MRAKIILCFLSVAFLNAAGPSGQSARKDDSLRSAVQHSFRIQYILRDINDTNLVQTMIQVDKPPTDMAFDLALKAGDDTWPLGQVAWVKGKIGWWAFDTDLPANIQAVDVLLTPNPEAAAKLKQRDPYRLDKLGNIWAGAPIVLAHIPVGNQEITMVTIKNPDREASRQYALEQMDFSEPAAQQLKTNGDWPSARAALELKTKSAPNDAAALYDLGCVKMGAGDLAGSVKNFVEVKQLNPPKSLARQNQRQLRRLCAIYQNQSRHGDATAMCALAGAYEHGWGVTQLTAEAKHWYRNAANAGNPDAMCRLAALYEHETGSAVHNPQSHEWYRDQMAAWYRQSAALGNEEAKRWLAAHNPNRNTAL